MGVYHEPETSDAWLGIWVWAKPNYVQERARIAERTATLIGAPWYLGKGTWNPFGAYARLADFDDHERAAAWLVERIDDLAGVGLLDLFPKLGSLIEADEGDQDEAE